LVRNIPKKPTHKTATTDILVRRAVERAVEGVLDRWAAGNTAAQTEIYVTKLRLTAAHLRQEAQAIDELADEEAQ
jgi:hypothetical protein